MEQVDPVLVQQFVSALVALLSGVIIAILGSKVHRHFTREVELGEAAKQILALIQTVEWQVADNFLQDQEGLIFVPRNNNGTHNGRVRIGQRLVGDKLIYSDYPGVTQAEFVLLQKAANKRGEEIIARKAAVLTALLSPKAKASTPTPISF
jgi:hypothetical protein